MAERLKRDTTSSAHLLDRIDIVSSRKFRVRCLQTWKGSPHLHFLNAKVVEKENDDSSTDSYIPETNCILGEYALWKSGLFT